MTNAAEVTVDLAGVRSMAARLRAAVPDGPSFPGAHGLRRWISLEELAGTTRVSEQGIRDCLGAGLLPPGERGTPARPIWSRQRLMTWARLVVETKSAGDPLVTIRSGVASMTADPTAAPVDLAQLQMAATRLEQALEAAQREKAKSSPNSPADGRRWQWRGVLSRAGVPVAGSDSRAELVAVVPALGSWVSAEQAAGSAGMPTSTLLEWVSGGVFPGADRVSPSVGLLWHRAGVRAWIRIVARASDAPDPLAVIRDGVKAARVALRNPVDFHPAGAVSRHSLPGVR